MTRVNKFDTMFWLGVWAGVLTGRLSDGWMFWALLACVAIAAGILGRHGGGRE